jgi:tRNA 2-thiouridine synthesizing protein A
METPEAKKEVDARGLNCPLPILKAKKALSELASGEVLKVISTDPGSKRDFETFARQTGNTLVHQLEAAREWTFYLQRR